VGKRQDGIAKVMLRTRPRSRPEILHYRDEITGHRLGLLQVIQGKRIQTAWVLGRAGWDDMQFGVESGRDMRQQFLDRTTIRIEKCETGCCSRVRLHLLDDSEQG
jgi:hypothetical protein